jgi:hypothetical protein
VTPQEKSINVVVGVRIKVEQQEVPDPEYVAKLQRQCIGQLGQIWIDW